MIIAFQFLFSKAKATYKARAKAIRNGTTSLANVRNVTEKPVTAIFPSGVAVSGNEPVDRNTAEYARGIEITQKAPSVRA